MRKSALDSLIDNLEKWQGRFDQIWFLILATNLAVNAVDEELGKVAKGIADAPKADGADAPVRRMPPGVRKPFSLAASLRKALSLDRSQPPSAFLPLVPMEMIDIPYSTAKAARRSATAEGDTARYIVDTFECGPLTDIRNLSQNVTELAAKLSEADPAVFGLLSCKGAMRIPQHSSSGTNAPPRAFQLVFRFPDGVEVLQSLRYQLLNTSDAHILLEEKIRLAREMAKSVGYVHTFAFVHKNIRPESIPSFRSPDSKWAHTCLVGFDAFRTANGATRKIGDDLWETNVYRHPERQGNQPTEKYNMRHDIYSLGVCLLEVGLWESFVDYEAHQNGAEGPTPRRGRFYRAFESWLQNGAGGGAENVSVSLEGCKLKEYLVEQAQTRLLARVGNKYAQVVLAYLSYLDESSWFRRASTEMQVAIRFMEDIITRLDKISI